MGGGDDKLSARLGLVNAGACFPQHRQVLAKFGGAAAGKNRDERFFVMELVSGAERGAIERRLDVADERVADEFCGDSGVTVELFFEREDAESKREAAADDSNTPGTPRPELRADVVGVAHAAPFEFASKAEMEAGEVGEDGESGFALLSGCDKFAHRTD